ncbi:MAG: phosphatase PAP2 family protein [Solirubrobacteraceae bacterium MAG38_C4-C5]|nr:phosphatase PAP2 family protein [Candidatus Siliceabacter maunaloa]
MGVSRAALLAAFAALAPVLLFGGCGGDGAQSALAAEPGAGDWRPWVLESGSQIAVPPPPREGSQAARQDDEELRSVVASRSRRDEEQARALARQPAVEPWLRDVMGFVATRPKDPARASRNYALVSVAMHDATIAAWHWKSEYDREAPSEDALFDAAADPSYPSEHAAIAGAASRVLAHLYPEEPAASLERQAQEIAGARVIAGVNHPSDVEAGMALGRQVADQVIERARTDGADREWDGSRPGPGPRNWEPPPGSAARPTSPVAGTWDTWVMESGSQFRPPAPPAFGTPGFREQAQAVVRAQEELTPEQKSAAEFWEGGEGTALPPGIWMQVVLERLRNEPLTTPLTTRLFASLTVAMADAGVAAWDSKYAYWYPRPENGIRDSVDPDWEPFVETPLFPAYVSGHSTYSAAAAVVLADVFPDRAELWRERGEEAGLSRIWGGIHWPVDHTYGARLGSRIGDLTVARADRDGAKQ